MVLVRGWSLGRGLAPSPDYHNSFFVPTQHPIFTPGPDNRLCNYYHELLHYRMFFSQLNNTMLLKGYMSISDNPNPKTRPYLYL